VSESGGSAGETDFSKHDFHVLLHCRDHFLAQRQIADAQHNQRSCSECPDGLDDDGETEVFGDEQKGIDIHDGAASPARRRKVDHVARLALDEHVERHLPLMNSVVMGA